MSFAEVTSLLGNPPEDPRRRPPKQVENSCFHYGWLDLPSVPHPRAYSFDLYFDSDARLLLIQNPFGDAVSDQGIPTKPILISPKNCSKFKHYPRIINLRWAPPAGDYPMQFEIQVDHGDHDGNFFEDRPYDGGDGLYHCFSFVGAQPGRVRVRAVNERGIGPWSDYRYFECLC